MRRRARNVANARAEEGKQVHRLEHMVAKNKGKPEQLEADRRLFGNNIEVAKRKRVAAEETLGELQKAADELQVPKSWRGDGRDPKPRDERAKGSTKRGSQE